MRSSIFASVSWGNSLLPASAGKIKKRAVNVKFCAMPNFVTTPFFTHTNLNLSITFDSTAKIHVGHVMLVAMILVTLIHMFVIMDDFFLNVMDTVKQCFLVLKYYIF